MTMSLTSIFNTFIPKFRRKKNIDQGDERLDQGGERLDQGGERLDQGGERLGVFYLEHSATNVTWEEKRQSL